MKADSTYRHFAEGWDRRADAQPGNELWPGSGPSGGKDGVDELWRERRGLALQRMVSA